MVNTRSHNVTTTTTNNNNHNNNNNNNDDDDNNAENSPVLPTLEQVMMMQAQMLQAMQ
jgi:hypothetical protein